MAYNFSAEKRGDQDLQILHERLSHFGLIEFFPVEVSGESLTLGISIPFRAMDEPRFENELENVMTYLVSEEGFQVTDLFTGNPVSAGDISGLAKQISG
ncbi:MAG: hypothetical protein HQ567_11635 [Candidatus Nealsonbacteria bacterium]|nr:hypothetical protein [Candidatus Nealsonbacteria bacterium]